ncbi:SDR family oxidoreductase [Azospirillum doebereinerae]|uniref:NAD-dependent epimerase/dehydratase family protein n=1 Tax=Azospirillum doebereinerae TaxID=92933 RepID=A0A433J433_9PROT|nr:SDR family oxidoreductase [Azospirillum doebereinerae]RUQ66760.1 NAD-dependent epimerase/dehydratase family protein [Azospirillum doebereinerae]
MILLTGGTGFLGGAFYLDAVRNGNGADYMLLVRGADEAACRARLATNLNRHSDRETADAAARLCQILPGDLQSLATSTDPRLDQVTKIVHIAADTSFDSRQSVWEINVDGTLALAGRARKMKHLQRFLHIGTAFCCGEAPHMQMVKEAPAASHTAPHIAEYTRSKAATEHALAAAFQDLPIVVARPSIVVGHTKLGVRPSASIFWYYRLIDRTGLLPCTPDGFIDIIPVDWATARLHDLLNKPDLKHKLYHVSAGEGARTTWTEFEKGFAAHGHEGQRPYTRFDHKGPEGWKPFDAAFRAAFPERTLLNRTMAVGARKYHRFIAQDIAFDNSRLLAEGFAPPPRFIDYLGTCLASSDATIGEQFVDDASSFEFDEALMAAPVAA